MQSHWHQEEDRDDHSSHSFQHCAQITSWSSKAWEGKQCIHIPILFFLVNCFKRSLALPGLCFLIIWTQDRKLKQTKLASFLYLALSYQEVEKTCGLDSIELLCSSWGKWVNINPPVFKLSESAVWLHNLGFHSFCFHMWGNKCTVWESRKMPRTHTIPLAVT